ncbi:MAG: DUF1501 domain-containing protein [Sandaracinaceae bacterium]
MLSRRALLTGQPPARRSPPGRSAAARWRVAAGRLAEDRVLVQVFLRGGADGLSLVPPVHDDDYHRARPTLGVRAGPGAPPLDDRFALHPGLAPLMPLYREGRLAVVHAAGIHDRTRSHFAAQDRLEQGAARGRGVGSGWLARLLVALDARTSPSAVALGPRLPEALRGAPSASVLEAATEHRLDVSPAHLRALEDLHEGPGAIRAAGRDALAALARLARLTGRPIPRHGAAYLDGDFGRRLAELARLVRAGVGLRVATVDLGGWDHHFVQGTALPALARELGEGLSAFARDLGPLLATRVTVLVVTEFGRRVAENTSLGTDHGRGSVALALGAGVRGGRVLGRWPGLRPEDLEAPGDVRVTTDLGRVLAEASAWMGADPERVIPGTEGPVGLLDEG